MTTKTKKAIDAILTHSPVTTKRFAALRIGERLRQGDIYITRVPNSHQHGKLWGSRQVAVGTTIGQRHVADGDVDVFEGKPAAIAKLFPLWDDDRRRACCGPVVVAKGRSWDMTHPEHPHHEVSPAEPCDVATYQITHQFDERTMQRVVD